MDTNEVRFVIRGKALIDQALQAGRISSLHAAAQRSGISYPTVHGWTKTQGSGSPVKISLEALPRFLIRGLGIKRQELLNMKVGDLFDLIDSEPAEIEVIDTSEFSANRFENEQTASQPAASQPA